MTEKTPASKTKICKNCKYKKDCFGDDVNDNYGCEEFIPLDENHSQSSQERGINELKPSSDAEPKETETSSNEKETETFGSPNCEICKDYPKEYWCGKEKTPAEIKIIERIKDKHICCKELDCNNEKDTAVEEAFEAGKEQGIELGRKESEEDFKENLLMIKTNHQLGCMLECYANVIENRLGFSVEAIKLEEIASKLK